MPVAFNKPDIQLTAREVDVCEAALGFKMPDPLRKCYLASNGGYPEPYVYEDENIDTVVSEFLPLKSGSKRGTGIEAYERLVTGKNLVPERFLPFAVDGGGDYFFVNCSTQHGAVYFYRGDSSSKDDALVDLKLGIADFWDALKPE